MPQALIAASAAIIFVLGLLHLIYTFFTRKFSPRDPELEARLTTEWPVITRQTTLWRSMLGFHASHSLGAMLFGAVYGYLAVWHPAFLIQSRFLSLVGLIMLASVLVLAKLYWFSVPFRGIALACVLYIAGFVVALT